MKWNIVADSSCDLKEKDIACNEVGFSTVPFILTIEGTEYVDEEDLDILGMIDAMENSRQACSSACPSPSVWASEFEKSEQSIAITISSNLSGSYNSAVVAKDLVLAKYPEKKIAVLDSRSTGPECAMCIKVIANLIKQGEDFENVVDKAQQLLDKTSTAFALCSFDNLVKNGRMGRLTGFVARKLGMWGIGIASDEGTIAMKGKSRGIEKAINIILDVMNEKNFTGGEVLISHCENIEAANKLAAAIKKKWKNAQISLLTTRGLDSFYAERGGLILAF